jgi:hypothetical protein
MATRNLTPAFKKAQQTSTTITTDNSNTNTTQEPAWLKTVQHVRNEMKTAQEKANKLRNLQNQHLTPSFKKDVKKEESQIDALTMEIKKVYNHKIITDLLYRFWKVVRKWFRAYLFPKN